MKKYIFAIAVMMLCACGKHIAPIYYVYNNDTVTRIDDGTDIRFYYGKITNIDSLPNSFMRVTYHGIDGSMEGYLIFEKGKVWVVNQAGYFKGYNSKLIQLKYAEHDRPFYNWKDSIMGHYKNVVKVEDYIPAEQKDNRLNKSEVKVFYNN